MTGQNLTDLLERAADRTLVGPPPLDDMLARARHVRRRRTVLVAAAASAAVVAVTVGTALLPGTGTTPQRAAAPADTSVSPAPAGASATDISLNGTWTVRALIGHDGQSVLPASYAHRVQLTFREGTMSGTTGCNDVFGTYVQSGDRGRDLVFPRAQLGSTLVGCRDEPPLVARLLDVRHVSGSGDVRYLHAANWMIVAELRSAGPSDSATTESRPRPSKSPAGDRATLTAQEYAFAVALARKEIREDDASVSSATVTVGRGTVTDSNLGHSCTSGRLLHIKLIGSFPRIVTSGLPQDPSSPAVPGDFTVHAVLLTADAESGRACLKGVQTGDVAPEPGSVPLSLG
ncbi:MAG TPA: META domain-containing protein [Nocardioidaceae bacterium]|nr:META domain-containing protein [Nocardioidaceae bacterium]